MMSELTRLRDEAVRLLTVYEEYKDSDFYDLRRKVHIDLDRFLMEHREEAMILFIDGLNAEINKLVKHKEPVRKASILSRITASLRRSKAGGVDANGPSTTRDA